MILTPASTSQSKSTGEIVKEADERISHRERYPGRYDGLRDLAF